MLLPLPRDCSVVRRGRAQWRLTGSPAAVRPAGPAQGSQGRAGARPGDPGPDAATAELSTPPGLCSRCGAQRQKDGPESGRSPARPSPAGPGAEGTASARGGTAPVLDEVVRAPVSWWGTWRGVVWRGRLARWATTGPTGPTCSPLSAPQTHRARLYPCELCWPAGDSQDCALLRVDCSLWTTCPSEEKLCSAALSLLGLLTQHRRATSAASDWNSDGIKCDRAQLLHHLPSTRGRSSPEGVTDCSGCAGDDANRAGPTLEGS